MFLNTGTKSFWGSVSPVFLRAEYADQLTTACRESLQFLGRLIGHQPNFRTNLFSKFGKHFGIDTVGLGQLADGAGKISRLLRINRDSSQTGSQQLSQHQLMVAA